MSTTLQGCGKMNKNRREMVLERDNNKCQLCKENLKGKTGHVHHIFGNRTRYSYRYYDEYDAMGNLVLLCPSCHRYAHFLPPFTYMRVMEKITGRVFGERLKPLYPGHTCLLRDSYFGCGFEDEEILNYLVSACESTDKINEIWNMQRGFEEKHHVSELQLTGGDEQ